MHAYVRSRVLKTEGLALRGYLSVTRWQAYAPPDAFRWGGAEAGCVGHNFQIYVQMFLSCGPRVSLMGKMPIVKFRGELKNALEAFSRGR